MRKEFLLGLALCAAAPAVADVQAGVDAWARGDYRRAVANWRGPAIAGDADAQFNLGQAYKLGRGVPVDPGLAESWFRKAALQGHAQAGDNYALALFQAGRKQDALPWLDKAVARGEPRCQLVLGTMLFNGDGAPRDYARAYALMSRAAAVGLPSASQTLARIDQYLSPIDRQRGVELAQQYAARAAASPGPPAGIRTADLPRQPAPEPQLLGKPKPVTTFVQREPLRLAPGADAPQPMRVGAGGWSAQLGAFRGRGNAEALWDRVSVKFPGAQPFYAESDGLVRLQASGYATKAAAQAACARAGVPCVLVAP